MPRDSFEIDLQLQNEGGFDDYLLNIVMHDPVRDESTIGYIFLGSSVFHECGLPVKCYAPIIEDRLDARLALSFVFLLYGVKIPKNSSLLKALKKDSGEVDFRPISDLFEKTIGKSPNFMLDGEWIVFREVVEPTRSDRGVREYQLRIVILDGFLELPLFVSVNGEIRGLDDLPEKPQRRLKLYWGLEKSKGDDFTPEPEELDGSLAESFDSLALETSSSFEKI